ncbi:MAG: OB-fold nucleic acid binding domain-containing protein, partial [Candidatus Nanohaloarchaea archaeon]|nr:OB-fold nucleic acid binding domain-containing protein [Candidatus Nanohaloarchaea archaeon]
MTARRVHLEDILEGDYHKKEGFEPNYVITPNGVRASRVLVVATVVDSFRNDDETYGALTLDDGTETIRAKFFQDLDEMDEVEEGDILLVVGKVREYEDERYLQPELLRPADIEHELLHRVEAEQLRRKWQQAISRAQTMQENDRQEDDILQELQGMGLDETDAQAVLEYLDAEEQFDSGEEIETPQDTKSRPEPPEAGGETQATMQEEDEEAEDENHQQLVLGAIEDLDDGEGADYGAIIDSLDLSENT